MIREGSMDETLCRDIRFQEEKMSIMKEIIDCQHRLLMAYEDRADQLQEELDDIYGNP